MPKINNTNDAAKAFAAITAGIQLAGSSELKNGGLATAVKATDVAKGSGLDFESLNYDYNHKTKAVSSEKDAEADGDVVKLGNSEYKSIGIDYESFDSNDMTKPESVALAALNIVSNNYQAEEDGLVKLCNVVTVPLDKTEHAFTTNVPEITTGTENINGIAVGGVKVPLISNLDNTELFSNTDIPFLPVLRTTGNYQTASYLDEDITAPVLYNGETVITAPIKAGISVDLRLLCSTTRYLADMGTKLNPTVTLSAKAGITNMYLMFKGASDLVNKFNVRIKDQDNWRFSPATQGHGKDLVMDKTLEYVINVNEIADKKTTVYTSTDDTYVFDTPDTIIRLEVGVSGSINTDSFKFTTKTSKITLKSVTVNGDIKTEGTIFDDIQAIVETGSVCSVTPQLYLSNTNNLDNGIIIDSSVRMFTLPAVIKAPVTIYKETLSTVSPEKVSRMMNSAKITQASMKAVDVYNLISGFINEYRDRANPNTYLLDGVEVEGAGKWFIKPAIVSKTINAVSRSTMQSSNTKGDIARHIFDSIVLPAQKVYGTSNMDKAIKATMGTARPKLVLAAGSDVLNFINTGIAMAKAQGDSLLFDVEAHLSSKLLDKVYGVFKASEEANEISTIIMSQCQDYFYQANEATGTGNKNVTKMIPRRNEIINSGVFLEFDIVGMEEALKFIK